jgi:flagellar hook-length control protein FliK
MDTSSIGALTGTADSSKKKKDASPGDADAFASAIGQASESEGDGEKKAQLIGKDESAKEKRDKSDIDKKHEVNRDTKSDTDSKKSEAKHAKGSVGDYLKNIASKDPATLSMAERSAFQLGEFSGKAGTKMSGVAQMLAGQGIDMSSFSPQQIMSLLSRMDTKELGKMMSQMRNAGVNIDEETVAKLKEQLNSTNQNQAGKEAGNFNLEAFAAAGMPKEAGETARQEQRRAVMDQLLTKIQVRNVANQTEMQLRLNPEYLGEVKIQLLHDDEGGIKAKFTTTSKVTSEILAENKDDLMGQASERGVRIASMDVEFVDDIA